MHVILALLVSIFALPVLAQTATVHVSLRPAGSFEAKTSEVKGFAVKKSDHVEAHNIIVGLNSLQTGITLRDEHTKKHLDVAHFPAAVLVSAEGRDGKGKGMIKIKGIEKEVTGTYDIKGNILTAVFNVKLSDFKVDGIKYMGIGVADEVKLSVEVPLKN